MHFLHDKVETERPFPRGEICDELPLLMPGWQWAALEREAQREGLTIGQFVRQLIGPYLAELSAKVE